MSEKHPRPPAVVQAIIEKNEAYLAAAGRKGAQVAHQHHEEHEEQRGVLKDIARDQQVEALESEMNTSIDLAPNIQDVDGNIVPEHDVSSEDIEQYVIQRDDATAKFIAEYEPKNAHLTTEELHTKLRELSNKLH